MPLEINVPADGSFMVELWGRVYGQETRTRFAFERGAAAELDELDALVGAVLAEGEAIENVFADLSQDLDVFNVRGYAYNSIGTFIGWKDYTATGIEPVGGAGCIPQVAWVVKKRTGAPGRSNRGRWYFPAVPLDIVNQGTIGEGVRAGMSLLATALGEPLEGAAPLGNILPAIMTFNSLGNVASSKLIGETTATWTLRSQRRREIGVGM